MNCTFTINIPPGLLELLFGEEPAPKPRKRVKKPAKGKKGPRK